MNVDRSRGAPHTAVTAGLCPRPLREGRIPARCPAWRPALCALESELQSGCALKATLATVTSVGRRGGFPS